MRGNSGRVALSAEPVKLIAEAAGTGALQKALPKGADVELPDAHKESDASVITPDVASMRFCTLVLMGGEGLATTAKSPGKTRRSSQGGAESGAVDPDLAIVVDAWATLPARARAKIVGLVRESIEKARNSHSS